MELEAQPPQPLMPRQVEGLFGFSWMAETELDLLKHLASFKPRILEIGTASGVTAACIAQSNPNASIICVDKFMTYAGSDYDVDRKWNWERNREDNMLLVECDSSELLKHLPTHLYMFDLIIIDGDHSYEGCYRDLSMVLPYCVKGVTSIVCHDYGDPNHAGVMKAVHQFLHEHPNTFRFVNIHHSLVELFYQA